MKIKLSKAQWEEMGKTAGWTKKASINPVNSDSIEKLKDLIQQILAMQGNFKSIIATIPPIPTEQREKGQVIATDIDVIEQYLDNAAGRISTLIHRIRN